MKVVSGRDLCKLLEKHDWPLERMNGSHHIYVKEGVAKIISVPVHGNRSLKRGLLRAILRAAEIEMDE